ncbi:MAG: aspartyl-tRNA(Asn)/glutamyl-tRNA(Gln) amidotransferase subunit A [Saprospiraceae bacterium]|mgnify:CR=1 FL=1|jgi:aspartyl-tRNA(Asn)/glutamyl-tRNA(Gln) amidotransferase subunit A
MIIPVKNLREIQSDLQSGKYSMSKLVASYLEQAKQHEALNIYIEIYEAEVKANAELLDQKMANGDALGSLFGCVISVKDVISQKDQGLTAASKILKGYKSPYNATAIQRVLAQDAIIIGRTNCDEFGMGSANENSVYGPTKNGADPERVPGGSSGAAAVSVQMNTCLIALGSDTGGSVRQPASFCGVYGLKPSYGRISRYGLIAYASSFDQIGILGHNPDDIGSVLEVVSGKDPMDATSSSHIVDSYDKNDFKPNPKIAYFPSLIDHEKLDESIKVNVLQKIEQLRSSGASIVAKEFGYADFLVPTYYVLTTAEASTNLSRYDGVRYGHRSNSSESLEKMYVNSRTEGFGKEVKRRIMLGTYVLSEGYFDAYFTKAQQVRRLITEEMDKVLEECDFLVLPTSTSLPWKVGEMEGDPVAVYLSDMYTVLANLTGLPAISIPSGTNNEGLPFGIQIMSKKYSEYDLLSIAKSLKSTTI